jgi:excisionase family DNA binding protein
MTHVTVRPDGLLTVDQAAALCGVSVITIRAWIRRRQLPSVRRERGKILLNIIEVLRTDHVMQQRSRRARGEPVTWNFDGEPDADADLIARVCMEAATTARVATDTSVVYYIRFGDRIKIGTTVNLVSRLGNLPHDQLLATEPGGVNLEGLRHAQFAEHRIRGEWFRPAPELLAHIGSVKTSAGRLA